MYDPAFTMWAKLLDPSGTYHTHEYMQMPGMRVQDRDTAILGDTSFAECKYACSKDESCKTFSFNKEKMECMKTGIGIHFDDKWIYSEKDVPVGKEKKIDHKKEAQARGPVHWPPGFHVLQHRRWWYRVWPRLPPPRASLRRLRQEVQAWLLYLPVPPGLDRRRRAVQRCARHPLPPRAHRRRCHA